MRTATAAIVTIAVTFAVGGMIAFCQADGPQPSTSKAPEGVAALPAKANDSAVADDSSHLLPAAAPADQLSNSPAIRRWGDPAPEPTTPESPIAAELAEIRSRVGSTVPQDWKAFGVAAAGGEVDFQESVQSLEAQEAPAAPAFEEVVPPTEPAAGDPSGEAPIFGGSPVPPALAGSQFEEEQGIPFKPSPFQPFPGDWEMGPPPGPYLPPYAGNLPFESPEALGELTKLVSATARDLERMAHVREEQRRYEEADRLRRLAMQLRRENRRLLPEPTPNPAYDGPALGRR